jgi:hypothetical protein
MPKDLETQVVKVVMMRLTAENGVVDGVFI